MFFSFIRFLLYPFALLYGIVVWLRNRLYDTGFSTSVEFSVPVICVGNLSVGGTGKTPHVEYLIRLLQYQYTVGTMSRGYKRSSQGFLLADASSNALRIGDEPMQYHISFPEAAVSVAEDRVTGIPLLLQRRPDVSVIILDDAFQHRSVKAGLNILITDFSKPFFRDYILPYGRLREGRSAYKRAQIIIVSKCPTDLTRQTADEIIKNIQPLPYQQVYFSNIDYRRPYDLLTREDINIVGKHILLVCCIARPEPLKEYLEQVATSLHVLSYPDHHYFGTRNLEEILTTFESWQVADKVIVTTEKDAARLLLHRQRLLDMALPIVVLPIEINILLGGQAAFNASVERYVALEISENNFFPAE